jgi:molybdenum cofactor cytidylyltransferase
MTFALIPAGGQSSRMGRPKLALALGDRSVLEWVIGALHEAGVRQTLVVVGPQVPELVPLALAAGAEVVSLPAETPDMRATVEHGLRWVEERWQPRPEDAWLLVPGDHPTLEARVVRQLLLAHALYPEFSILVPTYEGKRGHPTLIAWQHVAGIRNLPADQGLNAYLRRHSTETREVPLADAAILCDMDTPQDYERLQRTWPTRR